MSELARVQVEHAGGAYPILIGESLMDAPNTFASLGGGSAVIVTNPTVAGLYAAPLRRALSVHHPRVEVIELPEGEQYKTLATVEQLFEFLLANGCDRQTTLFALGGGVVGDLAGFAAATFMRGIDCVQVPTTLLAQTDSSVGGKTGVNHPRGKNMIGAFHAPRRVVVDLATLATLSRREFVSGLAEVIKYGAIADAGFFAWLEANMPAILARDGAALAHAVRRSCEIKAEVVSQDERETGVRAMLNFGHTTAHAIETVCGYGAWLHGEAVAAGMVVAASLSVERRSFREDEFQRLVGLIASAGLPTSLPDVPADRLLQTMLLDKKSSHGELRFVLLDRLGKARVEPVPPALVTRVLRVAVDPLPDPRTRSPS